MRKGWLVAAFLVFLGVLLFVLDRRREEELPMTTASGKQSGASPALRGTAEAPPGSEPVPRESSPDAVALRPQRSSGTLVLRAADGTETPVDECDLVMEIVGSRRVVDVSVRNGRWTLDVPAGSRLKVHDIHAGSRPILLRGDQTDELFETGAPIRLVARLVTPTRLHVLDAETGIELDEVLVLRSPDWTFGEPAHPIGTEEEDLEVVYDRRPSPLDIMPFVDEGYWGPDEALLVHSPGYAWAHIDIDHRVGGERTLKLVPGGDLYLRLTDTDPNRGVRLRIRRPNDESDSLVVDCPVARLERLQIRGLPPGAYTMQAEVGPEYGEPLVLASGSFEIAARETTSATLELRRSGRPQPVPLSGVLEIPAAWEIEDPELRLDLLDRVLLDQRRSLVLREGRGLVAAPPSPGVWHFDAGSVQPGRYQIVLPACGYRTEIEVGEAGRRNARVAVPPPVRVSLRVVDAATGETARVYTIAWSMQPPAGVTFVAPVNVARDEETASFRFRAPPGTIEISADSHEYAGGSVVLDLGEEDVTHVIHLRPATALQLVLRHGERALADTSGEMELLGSDGDVLIHWDGGTIVRVERPGRYRFKIETPPGFEAIAEREIDLPAGQTTRVEIELRPKR